MVAWLLFPDNTAFAKSALRAELPSVKSSHLAEAFAASLGFRTYAALLAYQRDANPLRPPLLHADSSFFVKRLSELGYSTSDRDIMAELAQRPAMPTPCWREFPRRALETNNFWFYQCQRLGLPNVYLHVGQKYRRLSWDCISTSPREDRHIRDQRGQLMRAMYKEFQITVGSNAAGRPLFFGSAFAGSVESLLPPVARTLADRFFEQLYVPMLDPAKSLVEDWP